MKNDNLRDSWEIKLKKIYLHFLVRIIIAIMFLCTSTVHGSGTELARPPTQVRRESDRAGRLCTRACRIISEHLGFLGLDPRPAHVPDHRPGFYFS
jgi:hypothetical protein